MKCWKCGNELNDGVHFCSFCGAQAEAGQSGACTPDVAELPSAFGCYTKAIKNYVNFSGRAPRREYWFFVLFNYLITVAVSIVGSILFFKNGASALSSLYSLFIFLPGLAVSVRRLHDVNRSGWWMLFAYLPIVGIAVFFGLVFLTPAGTSGMLATLFFILFVLVWLAGVITVFIWDCMHGTKGDNDYGPDPYGDR